jgi:YidC/Oxa1 family membrane protein insertase
MKDKKTMIATLIWAASLLFIFHWYNIQNTKPVPPLKQFVTQAQKLEHDAGKDPKKLKRAAGAFESAGNMKQYKFTEEGAEARLHGAIIYDTKADDYTTADKTYQSIINDFRGKTSPAAAEAQVRDDALRAKVIAKHKNDPGFKGIDWLVGITGRNQHYSYALALLLITLVFKLITTPLSHKQYASMKEMQKLQPLIKQLQEKYKDNQQELGKKMMDLYKEHGVNPLSGCLPLLVQMPILIGLYKYVILPYQFVFAKGDFLWIGSALAHKFPSIVALNLSMPDMPLLIIYTISMIISQKLSIVDPTQAEQQKIMMWTMPIMFAFIFKSFPAAFMLYWLFFNVISTVQQYYILKHPGNGTTSGPEIPAIANGDGGGPVDEQVKKSAVIPGNKAKRRRRRFQVVQVPQPVLQPTLGG